MPGRTDAKHTHAPERETEGGRLGPTGVSLSGERTSTAPVSPDPEVPAHSTRRYLTAQASPLNGILQTIPNTRLVYQ